MCGDAPAVVLSSLQSVLIVATASWLKVKQSIISLEIEQSMLSQFLCQVCLS